MKKLFLLLSDLLFTAVFLTAALHYRTGMMADLGAGFLYCCLAGYLAILSNVPTFQTRLLNAAYLAFLLGLLNYFATSEGSRSLGSHQVLLGVGACIVYGALLSVLIWRPVLPDSGIPVAPRLRPQARRLFMATAIALQFGSGISLALVFAQYWIKAEGGNPFLRWNAFQYAMLFIALFSGILAVILLWPPLHARLRLVDFAKAFAVIVGVLCAAALIEYEFRSDWQLFVLSSAAFAGAYLSFWLSHGRQTAHA